MNDNLNILEQRREVYADIRRFVRHNYETLERGGNDPENHWQYMERHLKKPVKHWTLEELQTYLQTLKEEVAIIKDGIRERLALRKAV